MSRFSLRRIGNWVTRPLSEHADSLSWYYHEAEYLTFTRRHALDFGGFIPREKLVVESAESWADSNNYKRYSNFHIKRLIREALFTGIDFVNFIDVGCGKGHPCIFARKYHNFAHVYGIDFYAPLIDVARQNAVKAGYQNVTFLPADATTWKLPEGNSLVMLNNPFREIILEKFLVSNLDHFKRNRSLIAYGNDLHRAVMCRLGFEVIYRSNKFDQSLLRYSDGPRQ